MTNRREETIQRLEGLRKACEVTLAKLQQQQPPEPEAFKGVSQLNMLEFAKQSRSGIQY